MKKFLLLLFIITCFSASAVEKKTNFSTEIFEKAKTDGRIIVINSYEVWCGTCGIQTKILDQAKKEFKEIIFLSYEQSKNEDIAKKLNIDYWTTIVLPSVLAFSNISVEKLVFFSTAEAEKQVIVNSKSKNFFIINNYFRYFSFHSS